MSKETIICDYCGEQSDIEEAFEFSDEVACIICAEQINAYGCCEMCNTILGEDSVCSNCYYQNP